MTVDADMIKGMVCNYNTFIGKSVFASSVMALVLYCTNPAGVVYVGFMILVGAGVYFGVLVLMRRI